MNMPQIPSSLRLRRGVGVVILHPVRDWVLAGLRAKLAPGITPFWQMPQGGIDPCELSLSAARREAHEETGVDPLTLVPLALLPETTTYVLPQPVLKDGTLYGGQTHEWIVFESPSPDLPDLSAAPDKEFSQLDWKDPAFLVAHTDGLRREPYEEVFRQMNWGAIRAQRLEQPTL